MSAYPNKNRIVLFLLFLAIAAFAVATAVAVNKSLSKSDNSYLQAHSKARWIKLDQPFRLNARNNGSEMALFRKTFELDSSRIIALHIRAFRGAGIWLDGKPLLKFDGNVDNWREERTLKLPELDAGKHELKIAVVNENAHPVLLSWAEDSDGVLFSTPEGWEASKDDFVWNPAAEISKTGKLFIGDKFKRADKALLDNLPYMLPLFLLAAAFFWMRERNKLPAQVQIFELKPELFRLILLALWTLMALNNFHELPLRMGMDYTGHYKYIEYVAENLKLPSPLEGWQMFQPPFYYIVSAFFYKVFMSVTDVENTLYLLRLIPLACGAGMIEISFRCSRLIFKDDRFLQIASTLFGGFMPMNFVMSQFWSNEPFAALFSGLSIMAALSIITRAERRRIQDFVYLGLFCGAAILSKATATLLIAPVVFFVLLGTVGEGARNKTAQPKQFSPVFGICISMCLIALVGGWYYLDNWVTYGKPFIGGWDKIREIGWWQDHGYRTWAHFTAFGSSILKPVYSTVDGIWDGLYSTLWLDANLSGKSKFASRPPWNDDLMVASSLLALIPSMLILGGIGRVFYRPVRAVFDGGMFLVSCVVIYFTAVAYLYLNLPIYSTAKASYTLGLLPCYGILAAVGVKPLLDNLYVKSAFCGFLAVWGSTVYLTYFV